MKIEPQYDFTVDFDLSYEVVLKNDSVGAIDKGNNIVIPIKYQFLRPLDSSEFLFGYKAKYLGEYYRGIITKD